MRLPLISAVLAALLCCLVPGCDSSGPPSAEVQKSNADDELKSMENAKANTTTKRGAPKGP